MSFLNQQGVVRGSLKETAPPHDEKKTTRSFFKRSTCDTRHISKILISLTDLRANKLAS